MVGGIDKLEHRSRPVLRPKAFLSRMARACLAWAALTLFGLSLGMAGYMATEGMGAVDAFVNAAMILSGMGPVGEMRSTAGKLFAGSYAILSGLLLVIATGFVLAPVLHRVMHVLHVENDRHERD